MDGDVNVRFKLIEFFGKTDVKNEVERFIANNELVFDLKRQQFRSDTQKINFMATLFRDEAQEWYEPYQGMERLDKPDWCLKYSLFVKELLDEFGDPKPLESASDRILVCKMKPTQDVRQYLPRVLRYRRQAQGLGRRFLRSTLLPGPRSRNPSAHQQRQQ